MESKNKKKVYIISGSSGVGKGTILKAFLERNPDFTLSISTTTRDIRDGEVDGVNYFFTTKEKFVEGIKNDEFLEWAEFSGNYYGTSRKFVESSLAKQRNIILEIETQGALQIKEKVRDCVLIFIAPPSYQDLEYRLRARNTESEEAIAKRLDFVKLEMNNSKYYDYLIVNDTVERAIDELEKIIKLEKEI